MSRRRTSGETTATTRRGNGGRVVSGGNATRAGPSQRGLAQTRTAARVPSPEDEEDEVPSDNEEEDNSYTGDNIPGKKGLATEVFKDLNRLVKNFIRYALACEYTRTPINRQDVTKKVLEGKYSRSFAEVFKETQARLENVFRMTLMELPAKEKHLTIQQRRREAQNKATSSSKSYILKSTLSDELRALPDIFDVDDEKDAIYQGIVTVVVALIYLNGGILAEGSLNSGSANRPESLTRYLRYLSIEDNTPINTTEKVFQSMVKQGYIDKVKDTSTGEIVHDYHLGPRGKMEIGKQGTMDFVKQIFGDEMDQDMEKRIKRSMVELKLSMGEQPEVEPQAEEEQTRSQSQTRKRVRRGNDDEEEDEEEERPRNGRNQRRANREESPPARRRRRQVEDGEDEEEEGGRRGNGSRRASRR